MHGSAIISITSISGYNAVIRTFNLQKAMQYIWKDVDDLWDEMDGLMISIGAINNIKQRIAVIENDMKYIHRDHNNMQDPRGGMH